MLETFLIFLAAFIAGAIVCSLSDIIAALSDHTYRENAMRLAEEKLLEWRKRRAATALDRYETMRVRLNSRHSDEKPLGG